MKRFDSMDVDLVHALELSRGVYLGVHLVIFLRVGPKQPGVALLVHEQVRLVHLRQHMFSHAEGCP